MAGARLPSVTRKPLTCLPRGGSETSHEIFAPRPSARESHARKLTLGWSIQPRCAQTDRAARASQQLAQTQGERTVRAPAPASLAPLFLLSSPLRHPGAAGKYYAIFIWLPELDETESLERLRGFNQSLSGQVDGTGMVAPAVLSEVSTKR